MGGSEAQVRRDRPLRRHRRLAFAKGDKSALALALVQVRDAAVRLLRVAALTVWLYSPWLPLIGLYLLCLYSL